MADVAFIGAGKMAEAIVSRIVGSGLFPPARVLISDVDAARLSCVGKKYGVAVADDNVLAVEEASCVVFAVKPQDIERILRDASRASRLGEKLFVSIAAGIGTSHIKSFLGQNSRVFRVMPNLPVIEGEGASVVCGWGGEGDVETVKKIFGSVGIVEFIDEDLMDAFTALSGSGPGFAAFFAESLASAGEKLGIGPDVALRFAVQTLFGAAKVMRNGVLPEDLRKMVSSPGGTTLAGLDELEKSGFAPAVEKALAAAQKRSKELSKGGGK